MNTADQPHEQPSVVDSDAEHWSGTGLWRVHTETGSVYYVARDEEGTWWFGGDNVPNPISARLPEGYAWRIQPPVPWPLSIGARLFVDAPPELPMCHPDRVPGGGKRTSPVLRVVRRPLPPPDGSLRATAWGRERRPADD